jgi:dipeptidyl aminopeptidase/acylaminoacyl peptidase
MLAYRSQRKSGYEADRWDLMVVEAAANGSIKGLPRSITASRKPVNEQGSAKALAVFDSSADEFVWVGNDKLLFAAEVSAMTVLFTITTDSLSLGALTSVTLLPPEGAWKSGTVSSLSVSGDNRSFAYSRSRLDQPPEVYVTRVFNKEDKQDPTLVSKTVNVSQANNKLLAELDLGRPESVTVKGADGTPMQMWILKPPNFDANKKWPVAYLVHGGPQGAWHDGWSTRWCPEVWAAQGYVVALPNPRGSTGFGQKYVDEITADWGGKCYVDLMKGVDYLESLPYVDKTRIGAAGGSFGGYMMNWFAVNTGRFKCLISHCSVWNFDSMYATTDELWFDEWEHGGPPWGKNRESYEKHSPQKYAGNLAKFKTPMLVIHNDLDFRCPIGQGHELFTALQRQGVPSRMVNFPDEGHWVLKPANSQHWHREVFGWLTKYVPPGGR